MNSGTRASPEGSPRWKKKYGDMALADAKRRKELEIENAELKKMLAESMLKNRVLEEVNAKVTMFNNRTTRYLGWCDRRSKGDMSLRSMKSNLRLLTLFYGLVAIAPAPVVGETFRCVGTALSTPAAKVAAEARPPVLPSTGRLQVLTVFARFADEPAAPVPEWADQLFDPTWPGSFAHFYRTMSFAQLEINGEVLPRRYAAAESASAYLAVGPGQNGRYGDFVGEILTQVAAEVDLSRFDNDGPDGIANSGDDDGWVDYLFINMQSVPTGFLLGPATGLAGLGLGEVSYLTSDGIIKVSGEPSQGAIQEAGNFAQTVGAMAHEFGHSLGLPDLFDTSFLKKTSQDPAADSAGIGRWGLMGWGAHGWDGLSGPVAFSARSLEQLGWISAADGRLLSVERDREDLIANDLFSGGAVYKIPLRAETPDNVTLWVEYLLLEYRDREAHYYSRGQPGSGLLVWHVRPQVFHNDDEQRKHLDLVAADGLYVDAGFPVGKSIDAIFGRDNLDFWAHDAAYAQSHSGNLGDASDLFDGVRYRRFDFSSNPSTLPTLSLSSATTGLTLDNMRPSHAGLTLNVVMPRWAGVLREEVHWSGEVLVDGDLTVAPEGRLVVSRNTQVKVAGSDRLATGLDSELAEIHVQGDFVIRDALIPQFFDSPPLEVDTTRFIAAVAGEEWAGIFVAPGPMSELTFPVGGYEIINAVRGLVVDGLSPIVENLVIRGFISEQSQDADGRGIFEPGVRILLALKVENLSPLMFLTNTRASISWDSPLLSPARNTDHSRMVSFPPGEKGIFFIGGRTPILSVNAEPGQEVGFRVRILKNGILQWERNFSIVVAGAPTAVADEKKLPEEYALAPNYPNHFNAATTIAYQLPRGDLVKLAVFNSGGQQVRRLVEQQQEPGVYRVVWDGRDDRGQVLATGVYLYRLSAGPARRMRRLLLLK